MDLVENIFGWMALITTLIGLVPQIYKAYRSKSTRDLSGIYLLNYLVGSISWVIYGLLTHSVFVVYSNIFGLLTCILLIVQKRLYDQKS